MKRVQLFEFEDLNWFPSWLRSCLTNLLVLVNKKMGIGEVISSLAIKVLKQNNLSKITDLGSGSGGAMPEVLKTIHSHEELSHVELLMTDLYPSKEVIEKFNNSSNEKIRYFETSIDATNLVNVPNGLKTLINSFHHLSPASARKLLKSAEDNKQPLLIYEMAENKIPLLVWVLLLPLSLLVLMLWTLFWTPFVRPLTWQQIVFTYLIPIIPICFAWDGQASLPRMYAMKDVEELLEGLGKNNYHWEYGAAKKSSGKKAGTYIIGYPLG